MNINSLISNWYTENKRDLPWRRTKNPYFIWLSEIILQQTRVQQGLAYYEKFVKHYPTVKELALADEQSVLNDWQGLGYYSRARNLHKAAKYIHNECHGIFPSIYDEIIKLPGVGDYTASAISSFAFDEPQAVLDGNVFRVLSRVFNWNEPIDGTKGKKEFRKLAQDFLDTSNPAEHNQAMMEFGATLCTPKKPMCEICPIRLHCEGYKQQTHLALPIKLKKTKIRKREMNFLLCFSGENILIDKRAEKDIWQHLFQLPLIDEVSIDKKEIKAAFEQLIQRPITTPTLMVTKTHLLSHQRLTIHIYESKLTTPVKTTEFKQIKVDDIENYPFPKPLIEYLNKRFQLD